MVSRYFQCFLLKICVCLEPYFINFGGFVSFLQERCLGANLKRQMKKGEKGIHGGNGQDLRSIDAHRWVF